MSFKLTQAIPFLFVWLWSTGFIGAKYGLPYIEPFFMLFVRFCFVLIIFYFLILVYKSQWLDTRQSLQQILIGSLIHGCYLGGVFFAIKLGVPAGISAIIVGMQPIVTSAIGHFLLKQKVNLKQLFGMTIGFAGISLVIFGSVNIELANITSLGIIACLISLFSISLGTILQKKLATNTPLLSGSFYQYIGAMVVISALTFSLEEQQVDYTFELFVAMTWLVLGLSVLAILLLLYMIREGEVAKVTSYFYLVPPVAVIQTWLLFDEKLGFLAIVGCGLSVIGVFFVVKGQSKTP